MEWSDYEVELTLGIEEALEHYKNNLIRINAGRANPNLLTHVKVDYYGEPTMLNEIATIAVPEARQLLIKPFDASVMKQIIAALHFTHPTLNPVNEGQQIRVTFPEVTTERRRELAKSLHTYAEQARIQVRNARHEVIKKIKADTALTEDDVRRYIDLVQKQVDKANAAIEQITAQKEQELLTI